MPYERAPEKWKKCVLDDVRRLRSAKYKPLDDPLPLCGTRVMSSDLDVGYLLQVVVSCDLQKRPLHL